MPSPNPDNIGQFVGLVLEAVRGGQWPMLAALVLVAAVWAARKWGAPKLPFLGTPEGGALLNIATGFSGAFFTALVGGTPFTWTLLWASFQVSLLAAGGWGMLKSLVWPLLMRIPFIANLFQGVAPDAEAKAKEAGDAAVKAAAIKTASDIINK